MSRDRGVLKRHGRRPSRGSGVGHPRVAPRMLVTLLLAVLVAGSCGVAWSFAPAASAASADGPDIRVGMVFDAAADAVRQWYEGQGVKVHVVSNPAIPDQVPRDDVIVLIVP